MKKMQKGFTLIELMVVVVIIGILAAVAVPKMFGMSDKAKMSELAPAAGTFERLQQTYIAETSTLGDEDAILWVQPQSDFFSYDGDATVGSMLIDNTKNVGACAIGAGDWSTAVDLQGAILRTASLDTDCLALTRAFKAGY